MKLKIGFWIVLICAVNSGCSPLANVARTMIIEPIEYCRCLDDTADLKDGCKLAKKAWHEFQGNNSDVAFSKSFEKGFKDGFADYLYAGGAGNPPPVPPRCYWKHKYETPEGHKIIDDWYAGFRHGASMAQASGLRRFITIPASTALPSRSNRSSATPTAQPSAEESLPRPQETIPLPPNVEPSAKAVSPGPAVPQAPGPSGSTIPRVPFRPLTLPPPDGSFPQERPDDFDDSDSPITMPGSTTHAVPEDTPFKLPDQEAKLIESLDEVTT